MSDTELLHKSKTSAVHRMEVFTGTGRRRAWTAQEKAEILAESAAPGTNVSAVARRHGLTPQQLFGWRRVAQQRLARESEVNGALFTPVVVETSRGPSRAPVAALPGGAPMIEIVLGAATVRVPAEIEGATLTMVLRAVRAAT